MKSGIHRLGKRAHAPTDELYDEIDGLKSSLKELRGDVVDLVSHALGMGRGGAHAVRDTASGAVGQLKNKLTDLKDRGGEGFAAVERQFEDRPVYAALIAFGVGFLVATLFTRK